MQNPLWNSKSFGFQPSQRKVLEARLLTAAVRLSYLSNWGEIVGLASSHWSVVLGFCPFGRVLCSTAYNVLPDSGVCSPRFHRWGIPPSPLDIPNPCSSSVAPED